jgi:hypothetical protein
MDPVDPQVANSLALGPVLDLIERWHQALELVGMADDEEATGRAHNHLWGIEDELIALPVAALRQLAEQHAAQLRSTSNYLRGDFVVEDNAARVVDAAADFLCAPRREPEAE